MHLCIPQPTNPQSYLTNKTSCLPVTALELQEGVDDSTNDVFDIFGIETALTFEIVDGEAVIVKCDTVASGDITLPDTYNGYPVTKIARRTFRACTNITAITLPNSL